ncbi:hypothetical protein [Neolewinella antarctica]|uniref:Uncharacterized protein n=1 Tax=Neolewinella antarctica TaxID=442734 RepID=A0ABX0XGD6_9BACT|nr:hypothetical protein [Neolewinella antarctica]NJC27943.1 hypothetical protein [Neolewinella antarctica]
MARLDWENDAHFMLKLFGACIKHGDDARILAWLREHGDLHNRHQAGFVLIDIVERLDQQLVQESIYFAYTNSRCIIYRKTILIHLLKLGRLPPEEPKACVYDAIRRNYKNLF